MQQQTFVIGDVVRLTGEQKALTVVHVTAERVRCAWMVGDRQAIASYPHAALRLVQSAGTEDQTNPAA